MPSLGDQDSNDSGCDAQVIDASQWAKGKPSYITTSCIKHRKGVEINPPLPKDFLPNIESFQRATLLRLKAFGPGSNGSKDEKEDSSSKQGRQSSIRGTPGAKTVKKITRGKRHSERSKSTTVSTSSYGTEVHTVDGHLAVPTGRSSPASIVSRSTRLSLASWSLPDFPDNYDYDAASDEEETTSNKDPTASYNKQQLTYHYLCKLIGEIPATNIIEAIETDKIITKHRSLGPGGAQAISEIMRSNETVTEINLSDNNIGADGTMHLCVMLKLNKFITSLTLSENNLKTDGLYHLTQIIKGNVYIRHLDISGNEFKDTDGVLLAEMLQGNVFMKDLNISNNALCERGGEYLKVGIESNDTLERLNLSWNHLRRSGALAISDALKTNKGLVDLNLAWNGFHLDGCKAIKLMMASNKTLENLDLSCNRIDHDCMWELVKGLGKNKTLQVLKLIQNPITTEGALKLVDGIHRVPGITIKVIDISDQTVDEEFIRKSKVLLKEKGIDVLHGFVIKQHNGVAVKDDGMVFINDNPLTVLMEYMRIQNLRPIDLFTSLDKDGSWSLSKAEFRTGLMKNNIPLSYESIDYLVKKLDTDKDGEVDFVELIAGAKVHKKHVLRWAIDNPEVPFEESDIGRINIKMQAIMTFRSMIQTLANKNDKALSESMEETIDELRMELAGVSSGKESLNIVKKAQAKYRAITTLKYVFGSRRNSVYPEESKQDKLPTVAIKGILDQETPIKETTRINFLKSPRASPRNSYSALTTPIINGPAPSEHGRNRWLKSVQGVTTNNDKQGHE